MFWYVVGGVVWCGVVWCGVVVGRSVVRLVVVWRLLLCCCCVCLNFNHFYIQSRRENIVWLP